MKQTIRLTETELKQMISESVNEVLNESSYAEALSSSQEFNEIKDKILWQVKRMKDHLHCIEEVMNPDNGWQDYHLGLEMRGLKEDLEYMQELGNETMKIMGRVKYESNPTLKKYLVPTE